MSLSPPSVEPVYGSMLVLFLSAGSYSDKFLSDVLLAFFFRSIPRLGRYFGLGIPHMIGDGRIASPF